MWTTLTLLILLGFYLNYVTSAKTIKANSELIQKYVSGRRANLNGYAYLFKHASGYGVMLLCGKNLECGKRVYLQSLFFELVSSKFVLHPSKEYQLYQ